MSLRSRALLHSGTKSQCWDLGSEDDGPMARKGKRASCGAQAPLPGIRGERRVTVGEGIRLKMKGAPPRGWKRRGVAQDWLGTDSSPSHVPARPASTFGLCGLSSFWCGVCALSACLRLSPALRGMCLHFGWNSSSYYLCLLTTLLLSEVDYLAVSFFLVFYIFVTLNIFGGSWRRLRNLRTL